MEYDLVAADELTRTAFVVQFKAAVASLLGIDVARIQVLSVAPGSVEVQFAITSASDDSRSLVVLGEEFLSSVEGGSVDGMLAEIDRSVAVTITMSDDSSSDGVDSAAFGATGDISVTSTGSIEESGASTAALPHVAVALAVLSTLVAAMA